MLPKHSRSHFALTPLAAVKAGKFVIKLDCLKRNLLVTTKLTEWHQAFPHQYFVQNCVNNLYINCLLSILLPRSKHIPLCNCFKWQSIVQLMRWQSPNSSIVDDTRPSLGHLYFTLLYPHFLEYLESCILPTGYQTATVPLRNGPIVFAFKNVTPLWPNLPMLLYWSWLTRH